MEIAQSLYEAQEIMDGFAKRTGIEESEGDSHQRYLWTDAFAVQSFFGLSHVLNEELYYNHALKLIDQVHVVLGRHRPDDERKGWISGLPEEKGKQHPTIGGLRIGKRLPERGKNDYPDERLEWERDGQYFHYLSRWCQALLNSFQETKENNYALWAAELLEAGESFVDSVNGKTRMYWKMNIDLSYPVVTHMGAHDPLEGLICAESAKEAILDKADALDQFIRNMNILCSGQSWATTDSLGIGGLLLNTCRAFALNNASDLPESVRPKKLWSESIVSLESYYSHIYEPLLSPERRLPFRECGPWHTCLIRYSGEKTRYQI